MNSFGERALEYIESENLIQKGDKICVGISGGADSVCLLLCLHDLTNRLEISLCAFHVNHCLRGCESDLDEAFVSRLCDDLGIPLKIFSFDVAAIAKKNKQSTEEAGREVRRRAAGQCLEIFGANKIALAHHANDSAETLLFNMARGTSLTGLSGIVPKNGNTIRPLLCFTREEIEEELKRRNTAWCTDSTNLEDEYSRNKLRLNVIPYLQENINAAAVKHMAQAAKDIAAADALIEDIAKKRYSETVKEADGKFLLLQSLIDENELIAGRIVMSVFKRLSKSVTQIGRAHIEAVMELLKNQVGRETVLPYKISARRVYDGVLIESGRKSENNTSDSDEAETLLKIDGVTAFGDSVFRTRLIEGPAEPEKIPKKNCTKWLDYDKLISCPVLRYKRAGDYMVIDSEGHRKKLKRLFTDEKVASEKRNKLICLADNDRIVWAVGLRISEDCKVSEGTMRILEVSCENEH